MSGKALPKDTPTANRAHWTPHMVEQRLAEAASVLSRLPPMRVYGYSNTWPRLLLDYSSMVSQRSGPLRLLPPDEAAIGRMEEALDWSAWLKPMDSRIAWQRANGRRWKEICSAVGLARAAAHEHWRYAHCLIAWRLNGKPAPSRICRRTLITRFRNERGEKVSARRSIVFADTFVPDKFGRNE